MDETVTALRLGALRLPRRGARLNYTEKLARTTPLSRLPDDETTPDPPDPRVEEVQQMAELAEVERASFQSVALAALQILDCVQYRESRLADAALSLAQREKLQHLLGGVAATAGAVRALLGPQSAGMIGSHTPAEAASEPSWWFALCEALHVLEEGTARIESLVAGQPPDSATIRFSGIIARLLEQHYHALLVEAEHWMD
jgi:hypothetical protein